VANRKLTINSGYPSSGSNSLMSYSPEFGIPEMFSKYLWTWPALLEQFLCNTTIQQCKNFILIGKGGLGACASNRDCSSRSCVKCGCSFRKPLFREPRPRSYRGSAPITFRLWPIIRPKRVDAGSVNRLARFCLVSAPSPDLIELVIYLLFGLARNRRPALGS
jgi:hypothetical protein